MKHSYFPPPSLLVLLAAIILSLPVTGQNDSIQGIMALPSDSALVNDKSMLNDKLSGLEAAYPSTEVEQAFPNAINNTLANALFITAPDDQTYVDAQQYLLNSGAFAFAYLSEPATNTFIPEGVFLPKGQPFPNSTVNCAEPDCNNPYQVDDPGVAATCHIANMQLPCAWSLTQGSSDVVIGIAERGINDGHPDLAGQIIAIEGGPRGNSDAIRHGTAVAGGAAAVPDNGTCTAGAGFNSSLIVSTLGPERGLMRLADLGVDIINLSIPANRCDWEFDPEVLDFKRILFQEVVDRGIVVTHAVNNAGARNLENIDGAIMVGQATESGNFELYLTPPPSTCSIAEAVAVDENIELLVPIIQMVRLQLNADCTIGSGRSSLAAPYVAGVAALMLDVNPCLTPAEIETIITTNTNPVPNGNDPRWAAELAGVGNLNAYQAVLAAQNYIEAPELIVQSGQTVTLGVGTHTYEKITIKTGGQLIANNARIELKGNAASNFTNGKITVERGAKLISRDSRFQAGSGVRCGSGKVWQGIIVHGNIDKEQPDMYTNGVLDVNKPLASDDAGVVILLDESEITQAENAISTTAPGYPYPEQVNRWGGLIIAENSRFVNNRRAVEFFQYPRIGGGYIFENKSTFHNCNFESTEPDRDNTVGITAWATKGIRVTKSVFRNLALESLLTINGGLIVQDQNSFFRDDGNLDGKRHRHISAYSTQPYASSMTIGSSDPGIEDNFFNSDGRRDVFIYGSATDGPGGLVVKNNDFFYESVETTAQKAILIEGPTDLLVEGNLIENASGAIDIENSGLSEFSRDNLVRCNLMITGRNALDLSRDNTGIRFFYNVFDKYAISNIKVSGEVNLFQGTRDNPANNQFIDRASEDIKVIGISTPSFRYYYTDDGTANNSFEPINPSGYLPRETQFEETGDCPFIAELQNIKIEDIEVVLDDIATVENEILTAPVTDTTKVEELNELMIERDRLVNVFTAERVAANDFTSALDILDQITDPEAKFRKYGLFVLQDDIIAASALLDTLDLLGAQYADFTGPQRINLQRVSSKAAKFALNAVDYHYVDSIALSESPYRDYSRGLMLLLEDVRYYDDDPAQPAPLVSDDRDQMTSSTVTSTVYPNPVVDIATISSSLMEKGAGMVRILDLRGAVVRELRFDRQPQIELSTGRLPAGMYVLDIRCQDDRETLKMIVQ